MGIVSKPMPLPVLPMRWANGASIGLLPLAVLRWRSPWPTRKATLCADAKRTEPSPSRLPRMSLSWSSLSAYCLVATRTSSPSSISHAWALALWREDDVVGRAGELALARARHRPRPRTAATHRVAVVVPLDHRTRSDLAGRGIHRHDLYRHALIDDLADLLGASVCEHYASAIRKAPKHHARPSRDLVGEDAERLRAVEVAGQFCASPGSSSAPAGRRSGRPSRPRARRAALRAATESTATTSTAPERTSHVGDLERLLAVIGLGDEQLVDVDADGARVRAGSMAWLGVDERAHAPSFWASARTW